MTAPSAPTVCVVLSTAPDVAVAEEISDVLVSEELAACVSILPGVQSVYRWEGTVRRDSEVLMVVKTTKAASPALRRRLVEVHPYDVPEVLVVAVDSGHAAYLDWVDREVRSSR